ncbi:hypothetical protein BMS3Abin03_00854 [bacterium BMS3Abin03]|nr:hypothetical protein BMS3Abin03_00854 [bacterium BMS3Abin03]
MKNFIPFLLFSFLFAICAFPQSTHPLDTSIGDDVVINLGVGSNPYGSDAGNLLSTGVLVTTFPDFGGNLHPMGIAFDGTYYWVVGGGTSSGEVAQLDAAFNLVATQNVATDCRSIFYNPADGEVYIKPWGLDLLRLHTNPFDGGFDVVLSGIFQDAQSKVCIAADGLTIFDHLNGTVREYDFATGTVLNTFTLDLQHDLTWPRGNLIAHTGTYLLTVAADVVYAYDETNGNFISSCNLPGMVPSEWSMAYTNGMFFITESSEATWYAWTIDDGIVPVELTSFTAVANNNDVQLNWVTATETNNRGFDVERKSDNGQFETIGFVPGHGTTTEMQTYNFTDTNVPSENYTYRLKQIDFNGSYEYSNEVNIDVSTPLTFTLEQNYPNPFNPSTVIKYSIAEKGFVKLNVYNLLGGKVAALVNDVQEAGRYEITFNASNLASGIYVYSLQSGSFNSVKKMILMK